MGIKDLKILFEKEKRVYLILAIWLIIGYTIFQFSPSSLLAIFLFLPLLLTCLIYFIISLILKDKIQEYSWKVFLIALIIAILLRIFLVATLIGSLIIVFIAIIGLNLFFFITTIFTSKDWYDRTIKWDEKVQNWPKPVNILVRIGLFFGGAIIASFGLFLFATLALNVKDTSYNYQLVITSVLFDMMVVIWLLFIIGIISVFFGRINYWLGIFFIFITILAINIIISVVIFEFGPSSVFLPFLIIQYLINLYLLLGSIAIIFGEQSKIIAKKLRIFTSESMIVFLIFTMASMEYCAGIAKEIVSEIQLVVTALAIPILIFIFAIYGIYTYNKKHKKEKQANE
ncbi:MAG: hypothetical protein ACFFDK_01995 [Promethearchaeota archaeon]